MNMLRVDSLHGSGLGPNAASSRGSRLIRKLTAVERVVSAVWTEFIAWSESVAWSWCTTTCPMMWSNVMGALNPSSIPVRTIRTGIWEISSVKILKSLPCITILTARNSGCSTRNLCSWITSKSQAPGPISSNKGSRTDGSINSVRLPIFCCAVVIWVQIAWLNNAVKCAISVGWGDAESMSSRGTGRISIGWARN